MKETLLYIEESPSIRKKYRAYVKNKYSNKIRHIDFGDSLYGQYKDSTGLGIYSKHDHEDPKRRINYFKRFSGTSNKQEALKKEIQNMNGFYSAKILSHQYLW